MGEQGARGNSLALLLLRDIAASCALQAIEKDNK
jgi:hypothetical protein